jgi:hypothetical protein
MKNKHYKFFLNIKAFVNILKSSKKKLDIYLFENGTSSYSKNKDLKSIVLTDEDFSLLKGFSYKFENSDSKKKENEKNLIALNEWFNKKFAEDTPITNKTKTKKINGNDLHESNME